MSKIDEWEAEEGVESRVLALINLVMAKDRALKRALNDYCFSKDPSTCGVNTCVSIRDAIALTEELK